MADRKTNKMVADGKQVKVAKNAIREALVVAHNSGNKKAISDEVATMCGVGAADFKAWKDDVNALRAVVWDYVVKKNDARCDSKITAAQLTAARELIFPKWKEVLGGGEKRCLEREMHVDPLDVEDLVGFCWDFMATAEQGTIQIKIGEGVFRRKVESLVGVIMARNEILNDDDRDTLTKYYGYQRAITKAISKIEEQTKLIKDFKLMKGQAKDEKEFVKYCNNKIKEYETKKAEAEAEKTEAESKRDEIASKAQAIEARIKKI